MASLRRIVARSGGAIARADRLRRVAGGEEGVAADVRAESSHLRLLERDLPGADGVDHRPNHRVVQGEEGDERRNLSVAARVGVGRHERVGELAVAAEGQIHREEADLARHVHGAQPAIELEAVVRHDALVDEAEIAGMKVAMALADAPAATTALERRRERGEPRGQDALERIGEGTRQDARPLHPVLAQAAEVRRHAQRAVLDGAERGIGGSDGLMEAGELAGERLDRPHRHRA
jgi:hypothetical protein